MIEKFLEFDEKKVFSFKIKLFRERFKVTLKKYGKGMKIWNFFFIEVYFLIQMTYGGDLGM